MLLILIGCSRESEIQPKKPNQNQIAHFITLSGVKIPESAEVVHWHDNYSGEENKRYPEFEKSPSSKSIDMVLKMKRLEFDDFIKKSSLANSERASRSYFHLETPIRPQKETSEYIHISKITGNSQLRLVAENNNNEFIFVYIDYIGN